MDILSFINKNSTKQLLYMTICYTIFFVQVYRRDYEEGGIVLDPMKATHTVNVCAYCC